MYAWSVENLLVSGRLQVLEYSSNVNVAQVLWGWLACLPFGFSFAVLQVSTWVLAVAGLCGLYLLLRELDVPRGDALLGSAALGLYPIYAVLGVTFMTDVPFVSLTILASAAMVRALRQSSVPWLIAASLAASVSVAIRAVGIVTPVAMLLALVFARGGWGRRWNRWALCLLPALVAVALAFWRRSHVFQSADLTWVRNTVDDRWAMLGFALPLLPRMTGETIAVVVGVVGLALLPLSLSCLGRGLLRRSFWIFVALVLLLAGLYASGLRYPLPLMTGGTWSLSELGGCSLLVPNQNAVDVPAAVCWTVLGIGAFSSAVALARASAGMRTPGQLFLLLAMTGHMAIMAVLWLVGDRYALVLVPYAIALLLSAARVSHRRTAVAMLVVFGVAAAAGTRDEMAYNRTLWQAVEVLRDAGVPAREINGGYMVNGWLQYAHPQNAYRNRAGSIEIPWLNGANELPYTIANDRADGWKVVQSFGYSRWLGSPGRIYVLKSPS